MFTVLVIDDDDRSREELYERLCDYGDISVLKSARGESEAMRVLDDFVPDVILLDVVMPMRDGLETLKRIRFEKRLNSTSVIMMSGIMLDHVVNQAMGSGADFCLWKPTDAAAVHECAKRIVTAKKCGANKARGIDEREMRRQSIASRLDDAGIDPASQGYDLLADGIEIACGFKYIYEVKLVESVYDTVAKKHNISVSSAERNMRCAIKRAWEKNPEKIARAISVNRRPTTGDFVAKIAHMSRYWL